MDNIQDLQWIDTVYRELTHLVSVELIKTLIWYVVVPIAALIGAYLIWKLELARKLLKTFRDFIVNKKNKIEFNKIYEEGNRRAIEKQHISMYLDSAHSGNQQSKLAAIQRLSCFSDDSAMDGLIDLLEIEKDKHFKYLIIRALHNVAEKRRKSE